MTGEDLTNDLIGNAPQLSDGAALEFEDAANYYVHINADVQAVDRDDNAITNIKHLGPEESAHFTRLSQHRVIVKITIESDLGSGYYCQSITLVVKHLGIGSCAPDRAANKHVLPGPAMTPARRRPDEMSAPSKEERSLFFGSTAPLLNHRHSNLSRQPESSGVS